MYQWTEARENQRDRIIYSYRQEWSANLISSASFHERDDHMNPTYMPWESEFVINGEQITCGGFTLARSQVDQLDNRTAVILSKEEFSRAQLATQNYLESNQYEKLTQENDMIFARKAGKPGICHQIGDIRISFYKVKCGPTTIIGQQISAPKQSLKSSYRPDINDSERDEVSVGKKRSANNLTGSASFSVFSFRPWNPKKESVEVGLSTYPDKEEEHFSVCGCCPCATVVNSVFAS
jgi:hypothetical protein